MRRVRGWVLAGFTVCLLGVGGTTSAGAQTDGPVADGDFTGSIVVSGGFTANISEAGAEGAITLVVDGQGPLDLSLRAGVMTGSWTIAGQTTLGGQITGSGGGTTVTITMAGNGTFDGTGEMAGPPSNYRLTGQVNQANTVTVTVPLAGTQSASSSDSFALDEPITDFLVLCQDIYGRWDLNIRQQIQETGFDEFVRGYFTASTGIDATEQAAEVEELISEIARWAGDAATLEPADRGLFIGRGLSLLDQAERLQAELDADVPCPPDPTFATQLTFAAQDALNTLIDNFPGITNTTIVGFGLGSGAIGSGSASPAAADALETKMKADVSDKFDEFFDDWVEGAPIDDLVEVVRTAQMLGMESLGEGGLSPTDILLVVTGASS